MQAVKCHFNQSRNVCPNEVIWGLIDTFAICMPMNFLRGGREKSAGSPRYFFRGQDPK
jgi:hypothetical protein